MLVVILVFVLIFAFAIVGIGASEDGFVFCQKIVEKLSRVLNK